MCIHTIVYIHIINNYTIKITKNNYNSNNIFLIVNNYVILFPSYLQLVKIILKNFNKEKNFNQEYIISNYNKFLNIYFKY